MNHVRYLERRIAKLQRKLRDARSDAEAGYSSLREQIALRNFAERRLHELGDGEWLRTRPYPSHPDWTEDMGRAVDIDSLVNDVAHPAVQAALEGTEIPAWYTDAEGKQHEVKLRVGLAPEVNNVKHPAATAPEPAYATIVHAPAAADRIKELEVALSDMTKWRDSYRKQLIDSQAETRPVQDHEFWTDTFRKERDKYMRLYHQQATKAIELGGELQDIKEKESEVLTELNEEIERLRKLLQETDAKREEHLIERDSVVANRNKHQAEKAAAADRIKELEAELRAEKAAPKNADRMAGLEASRDACVERVKVMRAAIQDVLHEWNGVHSTAEALVRETRPFIKKLDEAAFGPTEPGEEERDNAMPETFA